MRRSILTQAGTSFSASRSYATGSTPKCAHLTHRSVLQISGPDAQKFLKGLTSRDVEPLGGGYSGFLNASGRVLHAVFIIPHKGSYFVIHSTPADHPAPLLDFLPPFKLRSKVKIRDVTEEWDVWSAWGDEGAEAGPSRTFKYGSGGAAEANWTWPYGPKAIEMGCWDLRAGYGASSMGRQLLVGKGKQPETSGSHDTVNAEDYHLRRMLLGVPEGPEEIVPGVALPLESCMDVHGGVDFRKGCYLGQELTVRTYHTGATRKRILPIRSSSALEPGEITYTPPPDAASKKARSAGKVLSSIGQVGLGLVRMEMAEKGGKLTVGGVEIEVGHGEAYGASLAQQHVG